MIRQFVKFEDIEKHVLKKKSLKPTDKQLHVANGTGHGRFPFCFLGNLNIAFKSSFLVFQKKIINFLFTSNDFLKNISVLSALSKFTENN